MIENGSIFARDWELGEFWSDITVLYSDWVSGGDMNLYIGQDS